MTYSSMPRIVLQASHLCELCRINMCVPLHFVDMY